MKSISIKIYEDPVPHHKWNDIKDALSPEMWRRFQQWIQGQTCLMEGVYTWDFARWCKQGYRKQQGQDWD